MYGQIVDANIIVRRCKNLLNTIYHYDPRGFGARESVRIELKTNRLLRPPNHRDPHNDVSV